MDAGTFPEQTVFKKDLEPILEMLEDKSFHLSKEAWTQLVNSTKERIIDAPEQYLTGHNRTSDALRQTIETIFSERLN